jgi:hypothetical protein
MYLIILRLRVADKGYAILALYALSHQERNTMARLPIPGADSNAWGQLLNDFLAVQHNTDGSLKSGVVISDTIADGTIMNSHINASAAIAQSKISGLATALSSKVSKGDIVIRVADYGIFPSESTDHTAALQALIDALPATGSADVVFDAGRYKISSLNLGARTITLSGVLPHHNTPGRFSNVGGTSYTVIGTFSGTWLVSTATTGSAITFGVNGGGYPRLHRYTLRNIGVCGPGTGISTGIFINDTVSPRFDTVHVVNFYTGIDMNTAQDGLFTNVNVWGCGHDGLVVGGPGPGDANASNQNTFINTDLQFNTRYALRVDCADTVVFLGGVTEVNNGTPIYLGLYARKVKFVGWYFEDIQQSWPTPITWAVDVDGDENTFEDCRFSVGTIRFNGNNNSLINPYASPSVILNGIRNIIIGGSYDTSTITEAAAGSNIIINHGRTGFISDIFLNAGKRIYFGASSGYGNWIGRNANTGITEINSDSGLIKMNQSVQLTNAAVPATPTGGGVMYVENGALKYKGSSGTVTVIGPA